MCDRIVIIDPKTKKIVWQYGVTGQAGTGPDHLHIPDGFDLLPILPDHCKTLIALPRRHRDPFDRMLIAQARAEHLALLTRDRAIIAYGAAGANVVTFNE